MMFFFKNDLNRTLQTEDLFLSLAWKLTAKVKNEFDK